MKTGARLLRNERRHSAVVRRCTVDILGLEQAMRTRMTAPISMIQAYDGSVMMAEDNGVSLDSL